MKFGENLYNLRKGAKMSQENLAESVGVSRQSISKWENGESYPEMDNILKLCTIFNCKINDLVHGNMQDIDSLDEDIKMSVVKLEKQKQKKLKVLSKIIYVIARIGKIMARVASGFVVAGAIIGVVVFLSINVINEKSFSFKNGKEQVQYIEDEQGNVIIKGIAVDGKTEEHAIDENDKDDAKKIAKFLTNNSKELAITYTVLMAIVLVVTLVIVSKELMHLEKLFINIHDGDTPFTLENVKHIKMMTWLMVAITVCSGILSGIGSLMSNSDVNFNFGYGLVNILFLFSIAYIFEYGYELQKDSQGKIYGDEEEV